MHRSPLFVALLIVTVFLGVMIAAFSAAWLFGESPPPGLADLRTELTPTPAPPLAVPTPDVAPVETPRPDDLPSRLRALPEDLRRQVLNLLAAGFLSVEELDEVLRAYELRASAVLVGWVVAARDSRLELEVYGTGERVELRVDRDTKVHRGNQILRGRELARGELVLVLSRDGGRTAYSVTAFGIRAPSQR